MTSNNTNISGDACPKPKHVDGKSHIWLFDGDDPYIKCDSCKEVRDAITGRVIQPLAPSVADIPDEELIRRVVKSARVKGRRGYKHPRWAAVAEVFQLGSGYSAQLCRRFGLNPDEMVNI